MNILVTNDPDWRRLIGHLLSKGHYLPHGFTIERDEAYFPTVVTDVGRISWDSSLITFNPAKLPIISVDEYFESQQDWKGKYEKLVADLNLALEANKQDGVHSGLACSSQTHDQDLGYCKGYADAMAESIKVIRETTRI